MALPNPFEFRHLRLTIFSRQLAPYAVCFLRHLAGRGHELELIYEPAAGAAPFAAFDLSFCERAVADGDREARRAWLRRPDAELPDAALIGGWIEPLERAAGRRLRRLGRPVVCGIDNPWTGTLRQYLGMAAAPFMLWPMANIAWVAGAPQARLARRLGFSTVAEGLYCADVEAYRCDQPLAQREPALLFTGRLVADKGVDLLLAAYREYRQQVESPLQLWLAGTGPMAALAEGQPGVHALGFVQPSALPGLMARCRALVLPSRLENWGVVIHEAAAAGLPVLASRACMAAGRFVRDGETGYLYEAEIVALLATLLRFHHLEPKVLQAMSRQSKDLALTWTPFLQAERFEALLRRSRTVA